MRIIRIYQKGKEAWVDIGNFWSAINSKEDVKIIDHARGTQLIEIFDDVLDYLETAFDSMIKKGIATTLIAMAIVLGFKWPIVHELIPVPEIIYGVQILFGFVALAGLLTLFSGIGNIRRLYRTDEIMPRLLAHAERGEQMWAGHLTERHAPQSPKLAIPIVLLVLTMLLNSVVIASPMIPAVINGSEVAQSFTLVAPWDQWHREERFPSDEFVVIFMAPDEDDIWVLHVQYTLYCKEVIHAETDSHAWLINRMNHFVNMITQNIYGYIPSDASTEDARQFIIDAFSEEQTISELSMALTEHFNAYGTSMSMHHVSIAVEHLSLSEYRSYYEKQN